MNAFLTRYLRERQVSERHAVLLRRSIAIFGETLGHDPMLGDFDDVALNSHLIRLERQGYAASTVKGERARLLALWRAAFEAGLIDMLPRRIRKVRVVLQPPVAMPANDARKLLAAARQMPGRFKCGVRYADFLVAWILVGWESGLRFSDLLALPFASIRTDGTFVLVQQKSRKAVTHRLSADAMAAVEVLRREGLDRMGAATNWHCVYVLVRRLFKAAGVAGSSKKLRQSSGSWVESQQPGTGHLHLGNTRDCFLRHYADPIVTAQVERPRPPRIG